MTEFKITWAAFRSILAPLQSDAPTPEQLHQHLQRLWHERGGILVYPEQISDPALRDELARMAERRYGPRPR